MAKQVYHPNAYLVDFRNVKPGLKSRTAMLDALEKGAADARAICERSGMNYSSVLYHLRLFESREIVERKGSRPYIWRLTGMGQKRLKN